MLESHRTQINYEYMVTICMISYMDHKVQAHILSYSFLFDNDLRII